MNILIFFFTLITLFVSTLAADTPDPAYLRPLCAMKPGPGVELYMVRWSNAGNNTFNGRDSAGECGNRLLGEVQKRACWPEEFDCWYDGKNNACVVFDAGFGCMARVKQAYNSAFGHGIGCIKPGAGASWNCPAEFKYPAKRQH